MQSNAPCFVYSLPPAARPHMARPAAATGGPSFLITTPPPPRPLLPRSCVGNACYPAPMPIVQPPQRLAMPQSVTVCPSPMTAPPPAVAKPDSTSRPPPPLPTCSKLNNNANCLPLLHDVSQNGPQIGSILADDPSSHLPDSAAATYKYSVPNGGREKTPMARIAELARYNRLCHEYQLVDETGPAHEKTFTVKLVLRQGEHYVGQGRSIKKAQQDAATVALRDNQTLQRPASFGRASANAGSSDSCDRQTRHRRPPAPGSAPRSRPVTTATVAQSMSTGMNGLKQLAARFGYDVKLNVKSPKCGSSVSACSSLSPATMTPDTDSVSSVPNECVSNGSADSGIKSSDLTELACTPFTCLIQLQHKQSANILRFSASATTKQVAKHEAIKVTVHNLQSWCDKGLLVANMVVPVTETPSTSCDKLAGVTETEPLKSGGEKKKSPVSVIHEVAFHRKLDVHFEVLSASGPAHNRTYVVQCSMRQPPDLSLTATGTGVSKKQAKSVACHVMIEQLRSLSLYPVPTQLVIVATPNTIVSRDLRASKKDSKRNTLSKDMKSDPNYGQQINPISRLIQIQHARGEPEPKFKFVRETGVARQKEFVVEVTLDDRTCVGHGPNKKLAKRAAAELMLQELGYAKPLPAPGKSVLKNKGQQQAQAVEQQNTFVVDDFVLPVEVEEATSSEPVEQAAVVVAQTFAQVDQQQLNRSHSVESSPADEEQEEEDTPPPANGNNDKRRVTFQLDDRGRRRFEMNELMVKHKQQLNGAAGPDGEDLAVYTAPTSTRKKCKDSRRLLSCEQQSLIGSLARHFLMAGPMAPAPPEASLSHARPLSRHKKYNKQQHAVDTGNSMLDRRAQIEYIAKCVGFGIQFTDFPQQGASSATAAEGAQKAEDKDKCKDHLCLVTIGVGQPQVCHGTGATADLAQMAAACNALSILAQQYGATTDFVLPNNHHCPPPPTQQKLTATSMVLQRPPAPAAAFQPADSF